MKKNFRSLEIAAKTIINNFGTGAHISTLKDSIIDVDVTRAYQPGDRKLDSKSSLKTSQSMSRVFNPDKMMTIFLALDLSPSQFNKLEAAVTSCLYLIYLAELANDNVGLLLFNDKTLQLIPPNQDYKGIASTLERAYFKELSGTTNLEAAMRQIDSLELTNSLTVVVSDFCFELSDKILYGLRRLASGQNNTLISLVVLDEKEWQFEPMPFSANLVDSESGEEMTLDFTKINKDALSEWKSSLKSKLRQAKSEPIFVDINQPNYLMRLVEYFLRG